ncbi:hypothetical protein [Chryseobacterium aquaticum]|uniref:Uncharacterized protein n=1 Tax=Chryseobacterium aquaticum subsp. greenlandense TaxID=345663 RepID=A0A101CFK0_9FLAO|nr:hypothetical protein [Chryseobacterium aquaticum]KUJ55264.1 hypothetical protein AR686_13900 [Chryseobacterium aquaticum subsp. greenlandense]
MKTFIIWDYKIQSWLVSLFFIALLLDLLLFQKGICIVFYFLLALNHLISSNTKFFSKSYSKSVLFKVYYFTSMTFILSFASLLLIKNSKFSNEFLSEFWSIILSFGLLGNPFLAIIYYLICDKDYMKLKHN